MWQTAGKTIINNAENIAGLLLTATRVKDAKDLNRHSPDREAATSCPHVSTDLSQLLKSLLPARRKHPDLLAMRRHANKNACPCTVCKILTNLKNIANCVSPFLLNYARNATTETLKLMQGYTYILVQSAPCAETIKMYK